MVASLEDPGRSSALGWDGFGRFKLPNVLEPRKHEPSPTLEPRMEDWFYLFIIFVTLISNESQKFGFQYMYDYSATLPERQNEFFMLTKAYPEIITYFPVLAGLAVFLP